MRGVEGGGVRGRLGQRGAVGGWVERRPRLPDVARQLRAETRLMPWLARLLPIAVPAPQVVTDEPLVVRHVLAPGEPVEAPDVGQGRRLGEFLRALHAADPAEAVRRGVPSAREVRARRAALARDAHPGLARDAHLA